MYIGADWDPIDTGLEADVFTIDFVKALNAGETILSASVEIAVLTGTDAAAASRMAGPPLITGSMVSQEIDVRGAPLAGVYYQLVMTVATNQRPAITRWSHFWSRPPN